MKTPQTAEEYINIFRNVAGIVDTACHTVEAQSEGQQLALPRLAEAVEFIASLRGDSGAFAASRPNGLVEYQAEMYATEKYLRDQLLKLGYVYPLR